MPVLVGIHPVAEALRARNPLERVLIAKGAGGARIQEIVALARANATPLRFEPALMRVIKRCYTILPVDPVLNGALLSWNKSHNYQYSEKILANSCNTD